MGNDKLLNRICVVCRDEPSNGQRTRCARCYSRMRYHQIVIQNCICGCGQPIVAEWLAATCYDKAHDAQSRNEPNLLDSCPVLYKRVVQLDWLQQPSKPTPYRGWELEFVVPDGLMEAEFAAFARKIQYMASV